MKAHRSRSFSFSPNPSSQSRRFVSNAPGAIIIVRCSMMLPPKTKLPSFSGGWVDGLRLPHLEPGKERSSLTPLPSLLHSLNLRALVPHFTSSCVHCFRCPVVVLLQRCRHRFESAWILTYPSSWRRLGAGSLPRFPIRQDSDSCKKPVTAMPSTRKLSQSPKQAAKSTPRHRLRWTSAQRRLQIVHLHLYKNLCRSRILVSRGLSPHKAFQSLRSLHDRRPKLPFRKMRQFCSHLSGLTLPYHQSSSLKIVHCNKV
jgi:hypothetical protein